MARCATCGSEITSRFCPECGTAADPADSPTDSTGGASRPVAGASAPATRTPAEPPGRPAGDDRGPAAANGALPPTDGGGRRTSLLLGGVVLLVAVVVTVAGLLFAGGSTETVRGLFSLSDEDAAEGAWDGCEGTGGYSDLDAGVPVRIENQDGTRIGAATLTSLDRDVLLELAALELDGTVATGLGLGLDEEDRETAEAKTPEDVADEFELMLELGETLGWCTFYWEAEVEPAEIYNFDIGRRGDIDVDRTQLADDGMLVVFGID